MAINPFFNRYNTPHGTVPFKSIKFEHYEPAILKGISDAKKDIDRICSDESIPDFENTILALSNAGELLERVEMTLFPLVSAMSDDRLMDLCVRMSPVLSEFSSYVRLNEKLWKRVKYVWEHKDEMNLDAEDKMLLRNTYLDFANNGALLEGESRKKYRSLVADLSKLTTVFGQNVLKELNTYEIWLTREDLSGLPEILVNSAREAAENKGRKGEFLFTLQQPTYMNFMRSSDRRDLRERFYRLYNSRNTKGGFSNIEIIKKITDKRRQLAQLLGYENFASYSLNETMAKSQKNVYALLDKLRDAYVPVARRDLKELNEFAREKLGFIDEIKPWDYSYVFYHMKKVKYDYDAERLRPYFKLENTINGVFGLATRLYGIHFSERKDVDVYHEDVKVFEVTDSDGRYLGMLYADFFPRESKQPGAWMTEFAQQFKDKSGDHRPHISLVMNFTKPTDDKPSLLLPGEVGTFLHEFGHALHGLLSDVKRKSLAGTNVYRDFVELPSQFNENFLTEKEFLSSFARHYLTGEMIPDDEIKKMVDSAQFGRAYDCVRQLSFGYIDMAWHTIKSYVDNVEAFELDAVKDVQLIEPVDGCFMSPQFKHIFSGGYAAGYYSYKWSEVLDADSFALFKETGVFNPETAKRFRDNILSKGGSDMPDVLYRNFRGRDASIDALMRRDGILS